VFSAKGAASIVAWGSALGRRALSQAMAESAFQSDVESHLQRLRAMQLGSGTMSQAEMSRHLRRQPGT